MASEPESLTEPACGRWGTAPSGAPSRARAAPGRASPRCRERYGERHHAPVRRAGEPRRMVGAAGHGIEGDVVAAGRIEPALLVGHERLLRVPRRAADVDVGGRVECDQSRVLATPRALDRAAEARAADIAVADEDQGETGQDDLVHRRCSITSTPAPSSASQAAPPPRRARSAPPPPPRN